MITINAQITVPRGHLCEGCKYNHAGKHFCIVFQENLERDPFGDMKCEQCWLEFKAEYEREYELKRGLQIIKEAENDNG